MKKSLLIIGMCLFSWISNAQEVQNEIVVIEKDTPWSGYITNQFWDNWFISADFGGSVYFGTYDSEGSFGKRIAPTIGIGIGKWFVPTIGARVKFGGFRLKGFTEHAENYYITGPSNKNGLYKQKWDQYNIQGDMLLNISNWIGGYRYDRLYEVVPYLGFGMMHAYSGKINNVFTANAGVINNFRISDSFKAHLEVSGSIFSSKFAREETPKRLNGILDIQVGITYNFQNKPFQRSMRPVVAAEDYELTVINKQLSQTQQELNKEQESNMALEKEIQQLQIQVQQVKKEELIAATAPRAIFFDINSSTVSTQEKINLKYMANIMKQNPNKKYVITGYADAATGSSEYNLKISQERADNVRNVLINEFGVNANQLTAIGKGGISSKTLFDHNALNRVVIIE